MFPSLVFRPDLKNSTVTYVDKHILPKGVKLGNFSRFLKVEPNELDYGQTDDQDTTQVHQDVKPGKGKLSAGCVSLKVIETRRNNILGQDSTDKEVEHGNTSEEDSDQDSQKGYKEEDEEEGEEEEEQEESGLTVEINIPEATSTIASHLIDIELVTRSLNLLNLTMNHESIYENESNLKKYLSRSITFLIESINDIDVFNLIFKNLKEDIKFKVIELYLNDSLLINKFLIIKEMHHNKKKGGYFRKNALNGYHEADHDGYNDYDSKFLDRVRRDLILERTGYHNNSDNNTPTPKTGSPTLTPTKSTTPLPEHKNNNGNISIETKIDYSMLDELIITWIDIMLLICKLFCSHLLIPIMKFVWNELSMLNDNYQIVNNLIGLTVNILVILLTKAFSLVPIGPGSGTQDDERGQRRGEERKNGRGVKVSSGSSEPKSGFDMKDTSYLLVRKFADSFLDAGVKGGGDDYEFGSI